MSRRKKITGLFLGLAGIALSMGLAALLFLYASLPQLDGERVLSGLAEEVTVERDALGVATVRGQSRLDVARATGFLHAQDRFFQMDLLRRSPAGELAALVGPAALELDTRMRLHGLRRVAGRVMAQLPDAHGQLLQSYADGVNAGLAALRARPFEYGLLRQTPQPWVPADTVLVIFAMYADLQDTRAEREARLAVLQEALPPALFEFLAAHDAQWDAALDGTRLPTVPVPSADEIDLRSQPSQQLARSQGEPAMDDQIIGSNSWAIGPNASADGQAWLANDMHLGLRVPNLWYRLRLEWRDAGTARAVTGLSLPGTPAIIAGSNGQVAWGFTNSYGDWSDRVLLELDPADGNRYRTPDGYREFEQRTEVIQVQGGDPVRRIHRDTIWGPVLEPADREAAQALRWVAHDSAATDMMLLELELADDLGMALSAANRAGLPAQNFVAVDRDGNIGWTIAGRLPRRIAYDSRLPASSADGAGWDGWLSPGEYPRIVNPADSRIWTANNRVVGGEMLAKIGDGGFSLGARATQIRDGLRQLAAAAPADLLAMQLDDRALFLARWRELLLELLDDAALAADPRRGALRTELEQWQGRAMPGAVAYRLVRAFRLFLHEAVFTALTADAVALDPDFRFVMPQAEQALWRLATERPPHLLDAAYGDWRELLLAVSDQVVAHFWDVSSGLQEATWGGLNQLRMNHPLTAVLPWLGRWLNMPEQALPGDSHMPRVQAPDKGASQRMVVSPGREGDGILHMPGGQSGHPLSAYYRAGHDDWVQGRPTPFLPGPAQHRLLLRP